jgi:hypothetical protein
MKKWLLILVVCLGMREVVEANAAQSRWEGQPSSEVLVFEENSNIAVLSEDLVVDLGSKAEEIRDNARITAEYRLKNEGETVAATVAFPWIGSGATVIDSSRRPTVEIDGEEVPATLHWGASLGAEPKDRSRAVSLERAMQTVKRSREDVDAYGELQGTSTTLTMPEGERFLVMYSPPEEAVLVDGSVSYGYQEEKAVLGVRGGESVDLFAVGEAPEYRVWEEVKQGETWERTGDPIADISRTDEPTTLGEWIDVRSATLRELSDPKMITMRRNMFLERWKNYSEEYGPEPMVWDGENTAALFDDRLFVLVYDVELELEREATMKVSYAPTLEQDRIRGDDHFGLQYMLSPAKNWKSFQDLTITVKTPKGFVVEESSIPLERERGTDAEIFRGNFDRLPEGEFTLTVRENNPKILIAGAVLSAIAVALAAIFRKNKKTAAFSAEE